MKVGIAQINNVAGDFPGNAKRLLESYRHCLDQGAELILSPELGLCGCPLGELVRRPGFVEKSYQALDYLASEIREVPLCVGHVDESQGKFFSVVSLLSGGRAEELVRCRLADGSWGGMAGYSEADRPENGAVVEWRGHRIGVSVGPDLPENFTADLILAPGLSAFRLGGLSDRRRRIARLAQEAGVPVVFGNAVGGNDRLIFDGRSLVAWPGGGGMREAASFAEDAWVVDLSAPPGAPPLAAPEAAEELWRAMVLGLRDYVEKCGFQSACLGLSGGIDSALVAAIAAEALGPENVHGLTLPGPYSSGGSVADSFALAETLGISCRELSITGSFHEVRSAMEPVFSGLAEDVTEENMQARIRGVMLMAFSNKWGHLLLTTGNKSELAVGYCTIYGDMCGGLAVIGDVPKTRVYEICRWLNREREIIPWNTIDKPPSAELRPDQKDQDSLPEYATLDALLEAMLEENCPLEEIVARGHDEALVRWVRRHVDRSEWKRQQAAPCLRVTTRHFATGRHKPLAQHFDRE